VPPRLQPKPLNRGLSRSQRPSKPLTPDRSLIKAKNLTARLSLTRKERLTIKTGVTRTGTHPTAATGTITKEGKPVKNLAD